MNIKRTLSIILLVCIMLTAIPAESFSAAVTDSEEVGATVDIASTGSEIYGLCDNVQYGQILQCWNWSFNNIKANLPKIAAQGFTAIQTSPIQASKESTREYYSTVWNSSWVYYQPVAFNIETNSFNALGTKAEFEAMCEEAHKYGIKVIVDTIFNHMANDMSGNTIHPWIPSDIKDNSDCWHDISKNIYDFENRYDTTHYCLTGLPDLNTSHSTVQWHCTNFLKECIEAGADGFRFDAAKHIETDWDASGTKSDFWPNVLSAATEFAQETRGITPFYYGELLGSPGGGLSIEAYTQYMSVTDTGANDIRQAVIDGNASRAAQSGIQCGAAPNKTVQWTESHDTFKDNGTRFISDHNINKTWAIVGARNQVCGLYLARPENIEETMLGDADQTSWTYPEVKAVNKFKNYFAGQSEYMASSGGVAYIERGDSGVVLVNTGGTYYNNVSVPAHKMASGTYEDAITGNTFTVSDGYITGDIGDTGIAVVYNIDESGYLSKGATTQFSLAGTFNDWDTNANVMIAENTNVAATSVVLDAGTYTFKIKSNDLWFSNKGTISDETGSSGWTMSPGVSDNCTLQATGGKYTFRFNSVTQKLVVEHTEDTTSEVYLKGTFNDWDSSAEMEYVDGENKVKATVSIPAGTYTFKIHNLGLGVWYGNTGTITDTTGDTGWTFGAGKDKCTFIATGGTYEFTYDLSTLKLSVVKTDGETGEIPEETVKVSESVNEDEMVTINMLSDGEDTDWILNSTDRQFVLVDNATDTEYAMTMGTDRWSVSVPESVTDITFRRYKSGTLSHTIVAGERGEDVNFYVISNDDGYWESNAPEYGYSDVLLLGSFNDWKETDLMENTADSNIASITLELEAGSHTFKFKRGSTYYSNTGKISDSTGGNTWSTKTDSNIANCTLNASGGTYTFTFDTSTNRFAIAYLSETEEETTPGESIPEEEVDPLYSGYTLRGDFNDWAGTTPMPYATEGSSIVAVELELEAGTYLFKILEDDGDWYGNDGTIKDSTGSNGWSTSKTAGDITLEATGGTYIFSFDTSSKRLTIAYSGDDTPEVPDLSTYTVTFKDWDGTVLDTQSVTAGGSAVAPADPMREADANYTYVFTGWDTPFTNITADTVVTATYQQNENKYTVTFVDYDGKVLDAQSVAYGKSATAPADPTRASDTQFTYTFSGWEGAFDSVKADTVVTATYTAEIREYTVTFKDFDGTVIDTQTVEYGGAVTAPDAPSRDGYTFKGWDEAFDSVVSDLTVTAQYTKNVVAATTGSLKIDVTGGTGFRISVNGGAARPQGTAYKNSKTPIGATVTVTASGDSSAFIGWTNSAGLILTNDLSYTFTTTGDDYLKAMYQTDIEEAVLVIFKNDKANQILDMQYYAEGDEVIFPDLPNNAAYDATGWSLSAEEIASAIAKGESITVTPTWQRKLIYVNVSVVGGTAEGLTDGKILRLSAVTATADTAPQGQKFAYWKDQNGKVLSYSTVYKFYPAEDMVVTAVYVDENEAIDYDIILSINMDTSNESPDTNTVILSWEVPEGAGVTFKQAGSLLVDESKYNAETFYKGTTDANVTKWTPGSANQKAVNTVTVNKKGVANGSTWVLQAWLTYEVNGEQVTIYSDLVYVDKQ